MWGTGETAWEATMVVVGGVSVILCIIMIVRFASNGKAKSVAEPKELGRKSKLAKSLKKFQGWYYSLFYLD